VPDKLVICVRRQIAALNCSDTDSYLTINNISINWNNQAGILSSMSPEMLYRSSILSGAVQPDLGRVLRADGALGQSGQQHL
jgi:hypothetical protein